MINQKILKNSIEQTASALLKKGYILDIKLWNELEKKRSKLQLDYEKRQAQLNQISKEIGFLKSKKDSNKSLEKKAFNLSQDLKHKGKDLEFLLSEINIFLLDIPNLPDEDVPEGKSDQDNVFLREFGEKPSFNFKLRDHTELGDLHKSIDFNAASEITGSRFVVMKGLIAKLHRSLTQFMIDFHVNTNIFP